MKNRIDTLISVLIIVLLLGLLTSKTDAQEVDPYQDSLDPGITVEQIVTQGIPLDAGAAQDPNSNLQPDFVVPNDAPEVTDEAVPDEVVEDTYDPLDIAYAQLGKPYIYGSAGGRSDFSPWARGFDCSGFVSYVLRDGYGIYLPASTSASYPWTYAISYEDAQPGDVVYYNMQYSSPRIQHMALYIGDGQIIQSGGISNHVNVASAWADGRPTFRRIYGN